MTWAYKNQGRWVAHCSTDGCDGAERVWPGGQIRERKDGRKYGISRSGVLHCANCGLTSEVSFPDDQGAIDRILACRPVPETRNWLPTDTVESLAEENMAHGLDT
jgi:hypothetical protein